MGQPEEPRRAISPGLSAQMAFFRNRGEGDILEFHLKSAECSISCRKCGLDACTSTTRWSHSQKGRSMPERKSAPLCSTLFCGVLLKTVNTPARLVLPVTSHLTAFFGPNVREEWCQGCGLGRAPSLALQLRTKQSRLILPSCQASSLNVCFICYWCETDGKDQS